MRPPVEPGVGSESFVKEALVPRLARHEFAGVGFQAGDADRAIDVVIGLFRLSVACGGCRERAAAAGPGIRTQRLMNEASFLVPVEERIGDGIDASEVPAGAVEAEFQGPVGEATLELDAGESFFAAGEDDRTIFHERDV